jgi:hypothetical protein
MKILERLNVKPLPIGTLLIAFAVIMVTACNSSPARTEVNDQQADDQQNDKDGFVQIFDGKTLDNWKGDTAFWSVRNGVLTGEETKATAPLLKANTFLIWQGGNPADFELEAEYRITEEGNSGIQYRSELVEGVPNGLRGYQMDIDGANTYTGQNYEERKRCIIAFRGQKVTLPAVTGSVQDLAKNNVWSASKVTASLGNADSLKSLIKNGWNTCHIVAKGNHLQHYINNVLMCDVTDDDTANRKASGLIGLQLHAGHIMKIEFRNIRLKTL